MKHTRDLIDHILETGVRRLHISRKQWNDYFLRKGCGGSTEAPSMPIYPSTPTKDYREFNIQLKDRHKYRPSYSGGVYEGLACRECGRLVDYGHQKRHHLNLKQAQEKSCACGCSRKISTLGTAMSSSEYDHWKSNNTNILYSYSIEKVSGSPNLLCVLRLIPGVDNYGREIKKTAKS